MKGRGYAFDDVIHLKPFALFQVMLHLRDHVGFAPVAPGVWCHAKRTADFLAQGFVSNPRFASDGNNGSAQHLGRIFTNGDVCIGRAVVVAF
ncbi:hypothetical protein D3C71_1113200 [compost metagenome]